METVRKGPILFGDVVPEAGLKRALSMGRGDLVA